MLFIIAAQENAKSHTTRNTRRAVIALTFLAFEHKGRSNQLGMCHLFGGCMVIPIVLEGCKHAFSSRYPPSESVGQHCCPLCRAETTADSLLVSARLNAERANRPGYAPQEEGLASGSRL
jgi:hypothetical protein